MTGASDESKLLALRVKEQFYVMLRIPLCSLLNNGLLWEP